MAEDAKNNESADPDESADPNDSVESNENVTLNAQITDTITQSGAAVIGQAPSVAMGTLYQVVGNQWAMASANAVYSQQQANISYQAATTLGVAKLLSLDVAS